MLLTWLLHELASCELLAKSTCSLASSHMLDSSRSPLVLNIKPNITKLKQLQHFLSWNKANIKHNYKSQLYTFLKRNLNNVLFIPMIFTKYLLDRFDEIKCVIVNFESVFYPNLLVLIQK